MSEATKARETWRLPSDLTPLNLQAYLYNNFGLCGCSELDEVLTAIVKILEWHEDKKEVKYSELYWEGAGVFYLLAGRLDDLALAEHGTSIRYPWLTDDGKRLLAALREYSAEQIEAASG